MKRLTSRGIKIGIFKSLLEFSFSKWLDFLNIAFKYEPIKIPYVIPARTKSYTPDFVIPKKRQNKFGPLDNIADYILVETKGLFTVEDRQKMIWVKQSNPELDIRMVFDKDNYLTTKKRRKGDRGDRYSDWCIKHGFPFHIGAEPPKEWFKN